MKNKNLFNQDLLTIYAINVEEAIYRYNHLIFEFAKYNIENFNIIKAVTDKDDEVLKMYKENKVANYPPCFRCRHYQCDHINNFITPLQVANFLSFKKVMKIISHQNTNGLFLILEDDFYFKDNSRAAFKKIYRFINNKNLININKPLLLRIGSHTISRKRVEFNYKYFKKLKITENQYNMANPAFIINKHFADLFLFKFKNIHTTSDNFIHKELCMLKNVINYSFEPFPISQHSHGKNTNLFQSQIVEGVKSNSKQLQAHSKKDYEKKLNDLFTLNE